MSTEVAAVLIAVIAGGVACFAFWLRFKSAHSAPLLTSLEGRIERLENTQRQTQPQRPFELPNRMSVR